MKLYILMLGLANALPMYYSARPVSALGAPEPKITSVFFNMDATISISDELAEAVLHRCGRVNATTGHNITGADLIAAYQGIITNTNVTYFQDHYFGGKSRINTLKKKFGELRAKTNGRVQVLTASWAPVPEQQWAKYVLHLTDFLDMGFDEDHIIGVEAPGPPIVPEKAAALGAYQSHLKLSPVGAVLVDATFKYAASILEIGADFLLVSKSNGHGVNAQTLEQLLLRAGGQAAKQAPPKLGRRLRR